MYGEQLGELANLYFRIAGLPIRFWTKNRRLATLGIKWFQDA